MRHRFGPVLSALFPVPFLLVVAMLMAGFWQNDADFVLGRVQAIDAALIDAGAVQPVRGRPRYAPTFRLANGESLTLAHSVVASELPKTGATVQLLCSTRVPSNCRTPNAESRAPFYGMAMLWSVFAVGIAWLMWKPPRRMR